ncbi:MAG: sulfotransferase [Rhodobacteraceae bacterium]|nr:sulfotransferase [Paracoccaceae bacterium]
MAVKLPNDVSMLFCVGAQKAGTSWLFDMLSKNPECHFTPYKEVHYFNIIAGLSEPIYRGRLATARKVAGKLDYRLGPGNAGLLRRLRGVTDLLEIYTGKQGPNRHAPYLNYMLKDRGTAQILCDFTPGYSLLRPEDFAQMETLGRSKFIFVMRDPVARLWSMIKMQAGLNTDNDDTFEQACHDIGWAKVKMGRAGFAGRSDYRKTVAAMEASVPVDRIQYLFYEDLFSQSSMDEVCGFVGISPLPVEPGKRINEGKALALPDDLAAIFYKHLTPQYEAMREKFGARLPAKWRQG